MLEAKTIAIMEAGDLWQGPPVRGGDFMVIHPHFRPIDTTFEGVAWVPAPKGKGLDSVLHWALEHFPNAEFRASGNTPLGSTSITVCTKRIGFHHWAEAPGEVAYLRASHRHIFSARFTIHDLNHDDRDQEFHLVQAWVGICLEKILVKAKADGMSCEMMARKLCHLGRVKYRSAITCSVSEDDENSAEVTI